MEVIEQITVGRLGNPELCEDVIFVSSDFAAVFDGVPDRSGNLWRGMKGGRFAALLLAEALLSELTADATAVECFNLLTERLGQAISAQRPEGFAADAPAATALIYSAARREVWRVGDGLFAVDGVTTAKPMLIDEVMTQFRIAYIESLLAGGMSAAEVAEQDQEAVWQALLPVLAQQHHFANNPLAGRFAYGVVNGSVIPPVFIDCVRLDENAKELVIASDGYPRLFKTADETEAFLAEVNEQDPLRIGRYPHLRAKRPEWSSVDDRAYLRLRL